ncbi:MAG: hypothetical protein P8Z81_00870 [Deinococcales bacterium]
MRRFVIPFAFLGLVFALAACNSALNGDSPGLKPLNGPKGYLWVQKTAVPSNPSGSWNLTKTATDAQGNPVTNVTVTPGASTTLHYQVQATFTPSGGSYSVSGVVTVQDQLPPSTSLAMPVDTLPVNGSTDTIPLTCTDPSGAAITSWPYDLAYNEKITCQYDYTFSSTPPLDTTLTNHVSATGTWANNSTYTGKATAEFSFSGSSAGSPGSISIDDTVTCPTGFTCTKSNENTTTTADTVTYTYDLQLTAGGSLQCGKNYELDNVASIHGTSINATSTVGVYTGDCTPPPPQPPPPPPPPPTQGCTLTQGYWKTHSVYGPATPADPTWQLLTGGLGPDTVFYSSGKTWIELFDTPPSGGNAYIQLAHQFMAAELNSLAGASEPADVQAAMAWADTFFSTYTPDSYSDGAMATQYAGVLDTYNNGNDGVPSCETSPCQPKTDWFSGHGHNWGGTSGDSSCNPSPCTYQTSGLSTQGHNGGGTSGDSSCSPSPCSYQTSGLSAQWYGGGTGGNNSCDTSCVSTSGWLSAQGYGGHTGGNTSCNPSPCSYQTSGLSAQWYGGGTGTGGCATGGNDNYTNNRSRGGSGGW